jgi:hypothetical protein
MPPHFVVAARMTDESQRGDLHWGSHWEVLVRSCHLYQHLRPSALAVDGRVFLSLVFASDRMKRLPFSIWEAACGRFNDAERELQIALVELDRLQSLNGEADATNYSCALRAWCAAIVAYVKAMRDCTALVGSIEDAGRGVVLPQSQRAAAVAKSLSPVIGEQA